jgi:hypothetical protein
MEQLARRNWPFSDLDAENLNSHLPQSSDANVAARGVRSRGAWAVMLKASSRERASVFAVSVLWRRKAMFMQPCFG